MDNSRQTQTNGFLADETNVSQSMYLSFDAESTLSSTAFKTMEAGDTSAMGFYDDVAEEGKLQGREEQEMRLLNTLEGLEVNDADLMLAKHNLVPPPPPLGIFSTNILRGTFCSTPTKEQLMRSVEVARGSEVAGCINLGLAFQGVDDERQVAYFPPAPMEENKENAHPESGDGSTLSASSSVDAVTSVIERKMMTLSTEAAEWEEDEELEEPKESAEATPKSDSATEKSNDKVKEKRSIKAPKNIRKSICEPNLQTNRPSRILVNYKKRTSLAPHKPQPLADKDAAVGSDIPQLINKLLKISDDMKNPAPPLAPPAAVNAKTATVHDKRRSLAIGGVKSRTSLLPTAIAGQTAEKRSFTSFKHRMSVVVKTTLNSPARKIPRRSVGQPNANAQIRWGVVGIASRKSMLPTAAAATEATTRNGRHHLTTVKENADTAKPSPPQPPPKPTNRKTILSKTVSEPNSTKAKRLDGGGGAIPKPEAAFVCSICASKFRIKSLLEAHKRSHESDLVAALVKKPITGSSTGIAIANASNQCKYCDKKFALERALHIHLMEKCPKIPPADKRKLRFTEMNHVEKAQLPVFFQGNHVIPHSTAVAANPSLTKPQPKLPPKSHSNLSGAALSSTESLVDKKDVTVIAKQLGAGDGVQSHMGPPPSVNKIKIKSAHAGIYRTPKKSVSCHICKKSFKSIIELINHSDIMHPNTQTVGDADGGGGDFQTEDSK